MPALGPAVAVAYFTPSLEFASVPSRRIRSLVITVLSCAAACGTESVAKGGPSTQTTPAPASVGDSAVASKGMTSAASRDTAARETPAARPAAVARGNDSTPGAAGTPRPSVALNVPLPPGRTAHDSISFVAAIRAGERQPGWPVKTPPPLPGALLPEKRIVAFYGNPLSKRMGVLGEYPLDEMLGRLDKEVKRWQAADPATPVQPALHLIAVVAQGAPGRDGMYRLRMPDTLIEKVYQWAQSRNAILFLDIQVGRSTLQAELPRLLGFLARPNIHLGIDPEFSMHYEREGLKPGAKIGTMRAADVNYAVRTLSDLVATKHLPPKVLVVHRFTRRMLPDPQDIRLDRNVQVVLNMDGWGPPWLKFDSYRDYVVKSPVEFTGFKLFFHNDTKTGDPLITPLELLRLIPRPIYIQYQ